MFYATLNDPLCESLAQLARGAVQLTMHTMEAVRDQCAAGTSRGAAVAALRSRVANHVGGWLTDTACVQVALAATLRSPVDLLEFMLKPADAKRALAARAVIALKSDEFRSLFGVEASPTRTCDLKETMNDLTFKHHVQRASNALRCSLAESAQGNIWAKNWVKAVMVVAMHMNEYDERLSDILGTVVRGDTRRIEDVASAIDDDGNSTVMLSQAISSLASSVT